MTGSRRAGGVVEVAASPRSYELDSRCRGSRARRRAPGISTPSDPASPCRPVRWATRAELTSATRRTAPPEPATVSRYSATVLCGYGSVGTRGRGLVRRRLRRRVAAQVPAAARDRPARLLVRDGVRADLGRDPRAVPPRARGRRDRRLAPAVLGVRTRRHDDRRGVPHLDQRDPAHPAARGGPPRAVEEVRASRTSRSTSPRGRMRCAATASRSRPGSSWAATGDPGSRSSPGRAPESAPPPPRGWPPTAGASRSWVATRSALPQWPNASAETPSSPTTTAPGRCALAGGSPRGALRPPRPPSPTTRSGLVKVRAKTVDGHERTIQHNHLAPFLLTPGSSPARGLRRPDDRDGKQRQRVDRDRRR